MATPEDNDTQGFVSRRGKHVSLNSINMRDVQIDDIPGEPSEHITTPRSAPPKTPHHLPWKSIVALIIILVAIPVIGGEYMSHQYMTSGDITRQKFEKLVAEVVIPQQTKTDVRATKLGEITNKVEALSSQMCDESVFSSAAMFYPRAAAAHKQCLHEQEKYSALTTTLREYTAERHYLENLQTILKPLGEPSSERFVVISSQLEIWREAEDALKKLMPPTSMKTVQDNTYKYTYAVMEDWAKLQTAYNEKDGDEFAIIQKKMRDDYGSLQANASSITSVITASQTKLTNAYNTLR